MIVKLTVNIHPSSLKVVRGYRRISQTKLSKNIQGLSQPNLSKFLKGYHGCISEDKLKEIMKYLDFPFEFLYHDFPPLKTSNGVI